jgi:hypothetical protein
MAGAAPAEEPAVVRTLADLTPAERRRALVGIADARAVLRRRMAVGRETDEACDARDAVDLPRLEAASEKIGPEGWHTKTRFSSKAPNVGATVESFTVGCMGCTGFGPDDEAVPHECGQALTVLADLAEELRASK